MRGDIYRLKKARDAMGHEQNGPRFAIVIQADSLHLSTWLVAPTSTHALPTSFRPEIEILGRTTFVQTEQTSVIDPSRLGERIGHLGLDDLQRVDAGLKLVLGLD